jgi:DNA polymerase IIIc chi subunit
VTERKTREKAAKAPKVVLHRLAGTKKAHEACRLVERLYQKGERVAVFLSDSGRAAVLDEYLWTFAQHSFVPHVLWDGQGEVEDPVVVVAGTIANPNAASVLVIGDRIADPREAAGFAEVHDFVTAAPEDEGKGKLWEDAGFKVEEGRGAAARPRS